MHAPHVDVGLDSRRIAHLPATKTLDFLWLELTNRCNLRCVHCYTESHPRSGDRDVLTTQDYERLMREVALVLPHDTYLTSLSASSGGGTANEEVNLINPVAGSYTAYVHEIGRAHV